MINDFRKIGQYILDQNEYTEQELKYEFLKNIAIIPRKNENINLEYGICLNFDLEKGKYDFRLSKYSLNLDNREKYFAHSKSGSGAKIFLNTSNIFALIEKTIPDTIKTCESLNDGRNSKKWFKQHVNYKYLNMLRNIYEEFYILDPSSKKNEFILNPDKIIDAEKNMIVELKPKATNNKNVLNISDLFKYYLNKKFNNSESKATNKFPGVAQILINGQSILEYNQEELKQSYINVLYYNYIESKFLEKGLDNKQCHICSQNTRILKSGSPLPMNYYGTTNSLYFHKMNNQASYQSFAICETCTINAFVGMEYVSDFLSDYIFQNSVMLIPIIFQNDFKPKLYRGILKILKTKTGSYKDEINEFYSIARTSNRKNISMDMMFYHAEQNLFNILKYISNVESNDIVEKLKHFTKSSEETGLDEFDYDGSFNLNTMLYILFGKTQSGKTIFENKKIINFIATFINSEKYDYKFLLNNFNYCMKSRLLNDQYNNNRLAAFKMNLFLKIITELKMIKGVSNMENEKNISEVLSEDYREFFKTHAEIYKKNCYKQGLFLLGTVIAQILRVQKDKKSNFLKKMNFAGMSTRRLQGFINQVKEYTIIYKSKDIYIEKGIWGNIMDRLQGIETSGLSEDEVVFFLLSGISYSEYLGTKKSIEKKNKALTEEN